MNISPIGPAPITTTLSPRLAPVSSRPRTTQASGSVSAACSRGKLSGTIKRILGHDARRDADVFGVSAVIEEQVFTKVFLFADAPEASPARRRIQRHHAHARFKAAHTGARLMHHACQLMPEERRRRDHPGMVPTAEDFSGRCRK
jgi:hypothetical protein